MEDLVEDYLAKMDLLLDNDVIEWAWDNIQGIRDTVDKNQKISQRQMDTIDGYEQKAIDIEME